MNEISIQFDDFLDQLLTDCQLQLDESGANELKTEWKKQLMYQLMTEVGRHLDASDWEGLETGSIEKEIEQLIQKNDEITEAVLLKMDQFREETFARMIQFNQ
ncbi:hypothetical protein IPJ72_00325 [Candidatus Peregrinibacteria bacterium]|nr:MAG: hypothetical protein IPJ72_00325 [Candidatus Peregrinibacteria bacterium]